MLYQFSNIQQVCAKLVTQSGGLNTQLLLPPNLCWKGDRAHCCSLDSEGDSRIQGFTARCSPQLVCCWLGPGEARPSARCAYPERETRPWQLEPVTFMKRPHVVKACGRHEAQNTPSGPFSRPRNCLLVGSIPKYRADCF